METFETPGIAARPQRFKKNFSLLIDVLAFVIHDPMLPRQIRHDETLLLDYPSIFHQRKCLHADVMKLPLDAGGPASLEYYALPMRNYSSRLL